MAISLTVNGAPVTIDREDGSLLEALRDHLGLTSVKDGCSPQGQCGCCTVWVDGDARVACVTPLRRMAERAVTTLEGLDADVAADWGDRMCEHGGSQCGFCTAGIVMRLEAATQRAPGPLDRSAVNRALAAHLCRCTGWQTIVEAAIDDRPIQVRSSGVARSARSLEAASRRASIEGHTPQVVDPSVALGWSGFGDDGAPPDSLIAVRDDHGDWVVGETLGEARAAAAKVQGRHTTVDPAPPIDLPVDVSGAGWDLTLQTSWVEPAYLETDAAWCEPGRTPSSPLANGGAFGAKTTSDVATVARRLADEYGRAVRVRWSREDSVRLGVKRPPLAAGLRADGTGQLLVARTSDIVGAIATYLPSVDVTEVELAGPPTSAALRGAGWAEAAVLAAALAGSDGTIVSPTGASGTASIGADGTITVSVSCGIPLDETVLRSYCIGAAHMALGWVTSEGLSVGADGTVADLTIRSFGIIRPAEMPRVVVEIDRDSTAEPVCGSDAVFAAVASAVWHRVGHRPVWPTGHLS